MESNLELVQTEDLINELIGRFDHFLIGGLRVSEYGSFDHGYVRSWKGNHHVCMGIASDLLCKISQDLNGNIET